MLAAVGREIVLSGENFKVLRQLTLQIHNLSDEILSRWRWNSDIEVLLEGLVRSIPTRFRTGFYENEVCAALEALRREMQS